MEFSVQDGPLSQIDGVHEWVRDRRRCARREVGHGCRDHVVALGVVPGFRPRWKRWKHRPLPCDLHAKCVAFRIRGWKIRKGPAA